jgi:hypothetical protein
MRFASVPGSLGRPRPLVGDDGVELRAQQVRVVADEVDERIDLRVKAVHDVHLERQALMACRSESLLDLIEILRGLAFSATGICSDNTPPS